MNIASIDIGTNTVLLLIVKAENSDDLKVLEKGYEIPRIGKGVPQSGKILPEKVEELLDVLKNYRRIIDRYDCDKIIATGTNALRIADNSAEIIKRIKDETGISVKVIDGDEEAWYSYLGAVYDYKDRGRLLVIDVGGGSTELIAGQEDEIVFKRSFGFGAASLTEKFFKEYPPVKESIAALNKWLQNEIQLNKIREYAPETAVTIGGTPTTLYSMYMNYKELIPEKVEGELLSPDKLNETIDMLGSMTIDEIKEKYPVAKGREDLLLAGALIIYNIMDKLDLPEALISGKGIRYGAVINYLNTLD